MDIRFETKSLDDVLNASLSNVKQDQSDADMKSVVPVKQVKRGISALLKNKEIKEAVTLLAAE
ncbi:hypothetical protein [Lacticaseibacillus jixiensis]|uniref:hypothetical protein n=1 Tax=Lacticaseibacillus jixiensis TaxID=3231926 RepID=UPI0036F361BC